jgi:hypothetical protein
MPVARWAGSPPRRRAAHVKLASTRSSPPIRIRSIHPMENPFQPDAQKAQIRFLGNQQRNPLKP